MTTIISDMELQAAYRAEFLSGNLTLVLAVYKGGFTKKEPAPVPREYPKDYCLNTGPGYFSPCTLWPGHGSDHKDAHGNEWVVKECGELFPGGRKCTLPETHWKTEQRECRPE